MWQRLKNLGWDRIDPASLIVFRVVYGSMAAFSAARFFWYGWIDRFFYQRSVFFHFPGFEWVVPLPSPGMHVLFGILVVAGLFVALGLFYRVSLAGFLLGFTYVGLIDTTNYLNHYWAFRFIGLLMLAMPLGQFGSLDALRRGFDRGEDEPTAARRWMVWTLRCQLGLIYFFAGVTKLNWDWLVRGQPLEIWLNARTHLPIVGPLLGADWLAHAMSIAGAAFDLSIFFLLLIPSTRLFAYLAVVFFHSATGYLFDIGMFPVIMIAITPIFFSPGWPRRWIAGRWLTQEGAKQDRTSTRDGAMPRWLVAGLSIWFALQLTLPFRHLAYPGNVLWTQEGFRFSWRVKLAERGGYLKYRVRDSGSGQSWVVHPDRYLTRRQIELASTEPAKILQLAHHIAEDFESRGYGDVEVRADARVALNDRPSRRLVDPDVDLSEKPLTVWHRDWILSWKEAAHSAAEASP